MPAAWTPHLIVIGMYAFFVILILLWRSPGRAADSPGEAPAQGPAAPWWLAALAACIFLLVAFVYNPPEMVAGLTVMITFLGGGAVNLGFLVICFFVGMHRWLRRRAARCRMES
jgi:protein-S-isoprenylcysteine O-methyltransferase Ste14